MSDSFDIDKERCIVLGVIPYSDGRRIVRVLSESQGTLALWVAEGSGKKRQVGKWHPGALLELSGLRRKGAEGLVRFREARRAVIPETTLVDVRKSAVVFFLCELMMKLFPAEVPHPEVFQLAWKTMLRIESERNVSWIHAEFLGQLIGLLGIAPQSNPEAQEDVLDLQTGEWKRYMGVADDHLPSPLSHWFLNLCAGENAVDGGYHSALRNQLIQGQIRYLHHHLGGLAEIKSVQVLQSVFE